ncbi:unnamed protein product [Darwinula stevensoni]|uniref:C-type lectin domain-containing protein n=1 Tax=Darwinula stevensoni TaxID=69355 RepID=A0A7R9FPH3_9CRUS|nr:unnamed protein product [Darwinula stevensoni]CAG0897603.1 unnamed protein product [Darwinula stevensoni]
MRMAMGIITTQRFLAPLQPNMIITSPVRELLVLSELQCGMACKQNSTCFSYSVTQASGTFICRFGYRFDEPRTADANSKFFYRDVPIPTGYHIVPGTRSYVKITMTSINAIAAATACQNENAQLASSNNAAVNSYVRQLRQSVSPGSYIWVGGQSVTSTYYWVYPDGTNVH